MKQEKTSVEYGNAGQRFLAIVLDTLILLPISGLLATLTHGFIGLAMSLALHMAYYIGFLHGPWRATPGKRVMKLYVVSTQSLGAISKELAALRFIAYHIPTLPIYASFLEGRVAEVAMLALCVIWFVPILMTEENTGVHDMLCRTRVMKGQL